MRLTFWGNPRITHSLLGESERKNLTQLSDNAVGVVYNRLHHFLTDAPWQASKINERRLEVMNKCSQTRINWGFNLILDDSGHRKSGNFTSGVGRQDIGEIGKTEKGIVVVTTHLYDGKKSLPLDIGLDQPADSFYLMTNVSSEKVTAEWIVMTCLRFAYFSTSLARYFSKSSPYAHNVT